MTARHLPAGKVNLIETRFRTIWSGRLNGSQARPSVFTGLDELMRVPMPSRNAHMSIFQTTDYQPHVG
jgi:hypothetical protein